jgi:hypothetical protein
MARLASVLVLLSSFVWPDAGRAQSTDLSTYVVFAQEQVKLSGTNGVGNVGSNTSDVTFGGNSILLTGDVAGNRVRFSAASAGVSGTLYCNLLAQRSYQSFVCTCSPCPVWRAAPVACDIGACDDVIEAVTPGAVSVRR